MIKFHSHAVLGPMVRTETFAGREWLVAPVVAVREMVLGRGNNAELLTASAIEQSVRRQLWEGKPVTIGHPIEDGQWESAGTLAQQQKRGIGTFQNARFSAGKLKGEVWIDIALAETKELGREILRRLENQQMIEVSTGYWATVAKQSGSFNNVSYNSVQLDLTPDHLALLPNAVGKCSLQDGCGIPRINSEGNVETPDDHDDTRDNDDTDGTKLRTTLSVSVLDEPSFLERLTDSFKKALSAFDLRAKESTMDREKMIEALANCSKCPFDNEALEGMEDEQVTFLYNARFGEEETPTDPEPKGNEGGEDPETSEPEAKKNDDGGEDPEPQPAANAGLDPELVAVLKGLSADDLKEIVGSHKANREEEEQEKKGLIARICEHSSNFSKEELEGMTLKLLRKLESSVTPGDYSGRGGPRSQSRQTGYVDDNPRTPAILTRQPSTE